MPKDRPSTDLEARLRARLAQLGVNVTPEAEMIATPESVAFVGVRVADEPTPVPGSKPYACHRCLADTWFAPSAQAIIDARHKELRPTFTVCLPCYQNEQKS